MAVTVAEVLTAIMRIVVTLWMALIVYQALSITSYSKLVRVLTIILAGMTIGLIVNDVV